MDSDDETEIRELNYLTAVLASEIDTSGLSGSVTECSTPASTFSAHSDNLRQFSKIEEALSLNKLTDEKLRRLEKILTDRLRDCRAKLEKIQGNNVLPEISREKTDGFKYFVCGKPYFKDKDLFPAPDNDDTKMMVQSGMYDFCQYTSIPGWTVKDKSNLFDIILKMSREIKEKELNSMIAQLKRESKVKDSKSSAKKITMLQTELKNLKKATLKTIALPIDQEYDWELVSNMLNNRHSAQEYQSLWKLFLHPSINKNSWTRAEHTHLQKLAQKYNYQEWDKVAAELNTNRTGYQTFVYYRTNMSHITGRKWTPEEEEYLKRLIEYYREDDYIPWGRIAATMEDRTKIQVYNKYYRIIQQRKGRFIPEEDSVILTFVDKFGQNFKLMAQYLPGRSALQLRARYTVLAKKRVSAVWTVSEDKKLLQLLANQDNSFNYASICSFFPGKDRNNIRARYKTLTKWLERHPNADLRCAPRRAARKLGHGYASDNLNKAIEKLKEKIQSDVECRRKTKIDESSDEHIIENAIIDTFVREGINKSFNETSDNFEERVPNDTSHVITEEHVQNLKTLLIFLRAKLDRQKFEKSNYGRVYPGLASTDNNIQHVVKSYSKSNRSIIKPRSCPDIFGNNVLGNGEFVLPPNYNTIIGCRKIMEYASKKVKDQFNFTLLFKKNRLLCEMLQTLMHRFCTIFMWPILLSNDGPSLNTPVFIAKPQVESKKNIWRGMRPGVAIPGTVPRHFPSSTTVTDQIDLPEVSPEYYVTIKEQQIFAQKFY